MKDEMKIYAAVVWVNDAGAIGQRTSTAAVSVFEAKQKLEAIYGKDSQIFITNAEEASRSRAD